MVLFLVLLLALRTRMRMRQALLGYPQALIHAGGLLEVRVNEALI